MRNFETLRAQRNNLRVNSCGHRLILAFMVAACVGNPWNMAAADGHQDTPRLFSREYFERLQYYESVYPEEIFEFCQELYLTKIRKLRKCLGSQLRSKKTILARANHETGSNTLAQVIYDDCKEYHSVNGVGRIGACVDTRLVLFGRVGEIEVERSIYRKCESKWRSSGAAAIDVCCAHEGSYYERHGELRD